MKNLSWFNKTMFFFNIVLAVLTFVAYVLPFLAPKIFPFLSVLTLFLPMMLILNVIYFIYWGIQFKRQVLLSALVLLLGITFINKFYKFSERNLPEETSDFTVLSYNVRLFNKFEWSEKETVPVEISDFLKENNPDIVCIQEFSNAEDFDYQRYKYRHIISRGNKIKTGQAILSKFKIIETGEIVLPKSHNNVIFADIKKGKDTIRVYSIHLQSIKITPDVNEISDDINGMNQQKSQRILKRMSTAFKEQQLQAEMIMDHKKNCKYPIIICGDMNNSAFSYVYRIIRGDLQDSFEEAGSGFGKTYDFKYYPARIDYIFADKTMQVKSFKNFIEIVDSDHFPVMARLSMIEEKL
ncbi:endonuclease/exonuclease/phosphatase family protein [Flavobacterium soli]|uniref:endonuclease/exonuclease/phosphatase family protein n=1 Tax=Flavobacterium soli TaxID=344881 RepID=UPI00041D0E8E|nr:endonuclease/exonuclease/phosphatase family protein [Flavobacterium soli]